MKKLLFALIMVAVLALSAMAQPYQVGQTVDDFVLLNYNNVPDTLYSYVNKIMMLVFWTWG